MQLGVVGSKQEMCLLWAGVKGAGAHDDYLFARIL